MSKRKYGRQTSILLLILLLAMHSFCKPFTYNPGDPSTKEFAETKLLECMLGGCKHVDPGTSPLPPVPSNVQLSALDVSSLSLNPAFSPAVPSYSVALPEGSTDITLTGTAPQGSVSVTVNGTPQGSGFPPSPVPVSLGPTTVQIQVVNGSDTGTYEVKVMRFGAKVLTTEQSTCYNASGATISCSDPTFPGQDAAVSATTHKARIWPGLQQPVANQFTMPESVSGLVWLRCRLDNAGNGLSTSSCPAGGPSGMNKTNSFNACDNLVYAGFSDWRLPSAAEFLSIANLNDPSFSFTTELPNFENNLWTSQTLGSNSVKLQSASFKFNAVPGSANNSAHCVRGAYSYSQPPMYETTSADTVIDYRTGLEWDRCPQGLSTSSCSVGTANPMNWGAALLACQGKGTGWRVPTRNELISILDMGKVFSGASGPFIDDVTFPNTGAVLYSTSTSDPSDAAKNIGIDFGTVAVAPSQIKTTALRVRCVRSLFP
ncbi:hypothetical protein CH373_02535 [Leptospira perolatii]|uniref:Uncharacterized protein n=1 Tax=Leptospira perolatii TaxID=2023191 RepID=A0A2M9ZS57_9LEPT|nr:DUF1566 domain-containing protein [Leptospira perolatii]PJZ71394.1 hypothetical protein CH360_02535 [Leptospira perolatii]PJZ74928.1 hypothetical protein CH373_02535 [Leptospira perolatii]